MLEENTKAEAVNRALTSMDRTDPWCAIPKDRRRGLQKDLADYARLRREAEAESTSIQLS